MTVAGGLANIVLDWLFMGPLGMGVEGAAIATVIGYCIPAGGRLGFFLGNRGGALYFVRSGPVADAAPDLRQRSSEMVTNIANAITTFLFN